MTSVSGNIQQTSTNGTVSNAPVNRKKNRRAFNKRGKKHAEAAAAVDPEQSELPWPQKSKTFVRFPAKTSPSAAAAPGIQFGTLHRGSQQQPQAQPPAVYGMAPNEYKHQTSQPYCPHPMAHPMMYPMEYPMAGSMPGWMPMSPAQQFAYMPMSQPANFSYYPQTSSAPIPQNMYSMPANSVPANMHAVPQTYATLVAENVHAPSVVTAQTVTEQQKNLNARAKSFVPGRSAEKNTEVKAKIPVVASTGASSAAGVVDVINKDAELTSSHPLFKIPVRRAIRIVDPNGDNTEVEDVTKSADSKENAKEPEENMDVAEETVHDSAILAQEDVALEEQYVVVEKTDIPEDIVYEPVKAAEASDNIKIETAEPTSASKETDVAQNDALEEKAQEPTSLSKNSSRQVTFNEPSESNESEPKKCVLKTEQVVALYSGVDSAPSIVEDILRYPQEFLMQFNGLCTPPPGFNFEIASTGHSEEDRSLGMLRSQSTSHRRDSGSTEFGGAGRFRRSRTDDSLGSSSGWFRQGSSDTRSRTDNRFDNRTFSGRRGDRMSERSSRSGRGNNSSRPSISQQPSFNAASQLQVQDVKPLAKSTTGFVPRALRKGGDVAEDEMDEKVFKRRIMALLNIITPDNYDAVSDDLIEWGNKSVKETDGRILRKLVQLLVEKTADERTWMKMYANLFLKLISKISNDVQDHSERSKSGGYLSGGSLVRKYLLQKCQEDFERGWKVDMPEAKQSEEFYDALAIKRRGLGLVELIGELYLLDVLTAHIIMSSLRRMLTNIETPEKEVLESMMKLLSTVGKKLDTLEHKTEVNLYFERIKSMTTNENLSSRIRLLLMNTIELRKRRWEVRHAEEAPKSIAQLHQDMEREKLAKQARSSSGRRNESNEHRGRRDIDARNIRREAAQSAGDLSNFGNLSRSKPSIGSPMGNPFSAFAGGSRGWRAGKPDEHKNTPPHISPVNTKFTLHSRSSNSGSSSPDAIGSQNMFATLMDADESAGHKTYAEEMSTEEVRSLVKNMLTAYVETQNEATLVDSFEQLGETNYSTAVYQAVDNIMDRRPDQAEQATNGMAVLAKHNVVSEDLAIAALTEYSSQLEDLLLDVPHAFQYFGMLMAATRVQMSRVSEAMGELMTKVDMLKPPTMSIMFAYLKHMAKTNGEESTRINIEETEFDVSQFLCLDHRSETDIKRVLGLQDLLSLFPKYAQVD